MQLFIIRGLPGSGKSTIAKQLHGFKHFEADMFFIKNGIYQYDGSKIKQAHEWCQAKVLGELESGNDVCVSNTFTRKYEMQPYIDMAARFGILPNVIIATGSFKNVHGVPFEVVEKMRHRWEA